MTYCLAISTDEGLVFCSDSRTTAGPDMVSQYSKMHVFTPKPDRVLCLLSAGNLATSQAVLSQLELDLEDPEATSLNSCGKMIEVVRYVAGISHREQKRAQELTSGTGVDTSASFIIGGQIQGAKPMIYLIYSASNFISDSDGNPFLQIGESKYGKPILDRIIERDTPLEDAARCAIVSMDSTIKSNTSVGPPIEVLIYETDSFVANHKIKMTEQDAYLLSIKTSWDHALKKSFSNLPKFEWESVTQSQSV